MFNQIGNAQPEYPTLRALAKEIMQMKADRLEMLAAAFLKETHLPASEIELVEHPAGLTERTFFFRQRTPAQKWPEHVVEHLNTIRQRCEVLGDTPGLGPQVGLLVNDIAYLLFVIGGEFEPQGAREMLGSAAPPALVFMQRKPDDAQPTLQP